MAAITPVNHLFYVANVDKNQTLQLIDSANTHQELVLLKGRLGDSELLNAYIAKLEMLSNRLNAEVNTLRGRVSTFVAPDGTALNDALLSEKIRERIPTNTYQQVFVNTIESYQFATCLMRARKIELIRNEWGIFPLHLLESFKSFFSAAITKDSIYRYSMSHNLLLSGILASTDFPTEKKPEFEKQITAAYWRGQKIEIIVPFDFSDNGVIHITSESQLLSLSIHSGSWIRSLFTNN